MKEELRVGWKHEHNGLVYWWGSAKNRQALKQLVKSLEAKYGQPLTIEERASSGEDRVSPCIR